MMSDDQKNLGTTTSVIVDLRERDDHGERCWSPA